MWQYTNSDELYHYGVLGMKWGKRKAGYVTVYQAQKNATKAAEQARKESIAKDKAAGVKGIGSFAKVNRHALAAKRKAYDESIAADKAHNKQLRAEKKAKRKIVSNSTRGEQKAKELLKKFEANNIKVDDIKRKGQKVTIKAEGNTWTIS